MIVCNGMYGSSEIIYLIYGQRVGMDWAEKYRPPRLSDIVGNTAALRHMAEWARSWTRALRPLLLYVKPGIGKTSSAYALAHDMGWEVIELNASDQRTAAVIERIAGSGSTTRSLTGAARKLIVMDEADNLQGTADRGGARAIIDCIRMSQQPIILIANELYGLPPELRLRCDPVQFKAIPARSIAPHLRYICGSEKIECSDAAIRQIAESAEGDVRSAVNMLYAAAIGRQRIDDTQVHTSQKDERISIFALISALASKATDEDLSRLFYEVEDTPETIEQWIDGNMHLLVDPAAMKKAYRHLARADEYLGYTYRRQYHTLWRYATAVMLLGVADAAAGRGIHAKIMPPARWQKMAAAKKHKAIRLTLFNKIAGTMHIPQITLRQEYLGTFSLLVEHDPVTFTREFSLDAESLNFFLNNMEKAQEIAKKVAQEQRDHDRVKEDQAQAKKTEREGVQKREEPPSSPDSPETKQPARHQQTLLDGF
jgi:replication factor C large subunit